MTRATRAGLGWCARWALGVALAGCVYDPDDRCDQGQRVEGDVCLCLEGMVPAKIGCEPCADHEVAEGDTCACEAGYARPAEGEPCEELPEGLGASCDPDGAPCPADYPHCQPSDYDVGYCTTTGCSEDGDCEGGYLCDTRTTPAHCTRLPVGQDMACTTDADCAELEAGYCVTVMMGGCQVADCSAPNIGCRPDYDCCDLTSVSFPMLCVPEGMCPF